MKRLAGLLALAVMASAGPGFANDTTATLGAGGLEFVITDKVEMAAEDLSISPTAVKVVYTFKNDAPADQHVLVAFPLPDITGSGDFTVGIPTDDPKNIFGFKTTFEGKPVDATLHQYAVAVGIDQTAYLEKLGVPLAPYGDATIKAINALSDADHQRMQQLGLVFPMDYNDGSGDKTDWTPIWTLRSTYSWEADFPANKSVTVVHSYTPSVGGTVAVTFLAPPSSDGDRGAEYKKKYCTDDDFIRTVKKSLKTASDPFSAPYTESWLSYVWSTGANWNGPIHSFHLTIDKGSPANLVSFCWDGKVAKTGPTSFSMQATDFEPPDDRELEILLLTPEQRDMSLRIRPATVGDAARIVSFIMDLAVYEKLAHEAKATPADIARDLFGPSPKAFCDIAEWAGTPIGFALWFYTYSTFAGRPGIWLEDLFVDPAARRRGAGKALLRSLARRCVDEGLGRLEWWVLDWNTPSIEFYQAQGAMLQDDWTKCRLDGDALLKLGAA